MGLKGLCMLIIFWVHSSIPGPSSDISLRAVEFLFVVSGFLVGYNAYAREVPATWDESFRYVLKKLALFWPLHCLCTILVAVVCVHPLLTSKNAILALMNLSLLQAWSPARDVLFSFNGASWFLSALIFCYFMTPVLLRFAKRIRPACVLFLLVFLTRFLVEYLVARHPNEYLSLVVHCNPVVRCLEFFMGMLMVPLFMAARERLSDKKSSWWMSLAEILAFGIYAAAAVRFHSSWNYALFVLLGAGVIFVFAFDRGLLSRFLSLKPFRWFSKIQLEFYLFHQALLLCLDAVLGDRIPDWRLMAPLSFLLILSCAVAYKRWLEKPLSRCFRKLTDAILRFFAPDWDQVRG